MEWPRLLAYITGRVDKELLVRNEYLAAENHILRTKIKGRLQLSDGEKRTLAEIAHRLGRKALAQIAVAAKPDGTAPAPKRRHTARWRDFIRAHMDVLAATDFFTVEVLTLKGLVTYYVPFFIQLESRRILSGGNDAASRAGVDGKVSSQPDHKGHGIPGPQSLPAARPQR
ncbi:MAG: hypothetical protein H0X25_14830 [Acidobacteriales bacterium]|nr:hypothetical protein [Terriglobales bacterium]